MSRPPDGDESPLVVVADFNETLVRERTLPAWCVDRLRRGPLTARLQVLLAAFPLGFASIVADRLGAPVLAARIGFRAFRGVRLSTLTTWAQTRLSPNPAAHAALERLAREAPFLTLIPVSRGTPVEIIRAYLARDDVHERLRLSRTVVSRDALAAELEVRAGVCTGRLRNPPTPKSARHLLVPEGAVYLGDRRDARWARRLLERGLRFERV